MIAVGVDPAPSRNHRAFWPAALLLVVLVSPVSRGDEAAEKTPKKFPEWSEVTKDCDRLNGILPLFYDEKGQKLFMEISRDKYEREFIFPIAISRGAGSALLGGDTLNFGDQWILSFRRVADRILVIRRNVYFKAESGSPQADAVRTSYNDSVIAALPIKSEQAGGQQVLVDLADLLMSDLPNIGLTPDRSRSTWSKVKAFPENVEIEVSLVAPLRNFFDPAVPDSRGAQIAVHYGLSLLPSEGAYKPRLADDRVGHFLSVVKDYSSDLDDSAFQRYVTRWKLEKSSSEDKSPPKEPIIFWIEKSVPREYRGYVKAGILEWNKAFEKIGFLDAIQVRDQQAGDDFDPEDIRYNTFRWITTSRAFAMGPSRTNPKTGQILDADIVFDESMVRYWRSDYLQTTGLPQGLDLLVDGERQAWFKLHAADIPFLTQSEPELTRKLAEARTHAATAAVESNFSREWHRHTAGMECCMLGMGMSRQMGLMAAVLQAQGKAPGGKVPEEYIGQAIKEVVMHEVGHTLGLRHNFKASTMLSLQDASNPEITKEKGNSGSIMDYLPANFALKGEKQGHYFSPTIGPYDYWAIEYAYSPVKGEEKEELAKIAARIADPGHDFATDEDLYSNPDPRINTFDLGDPLDYAKHRIQFVEQNLDNLAERVVAEGEGWQRARIAFGHLLGELSSATYLTVQYIGSEYAYRDHRGDPNARLPFEPIPAEKQREALAMIKEKILAVDSLTFPPDLLNRLAPEQFRHWGQNAGKREPVRVMDQILAIQRIALSHLLNGGTLSKVQNAELHVPAGTDHVRMPEIFDALSVAIWSELPAKDATIAADQKIAISTGRRNLQRDHFKRLARLTLGDQQGVDFFFDATGAAPADARSLARFHLRQLQERIGKTLESPAQIDSYSRAHLEELRDQIDKVLTASLEINDP